MATLLFLVLLICQKRTPKEKSIRKAFSKSLRFCCKLVPCIAADDEAWLGDGSRDAFICKRCKRLAEACGCNATLCEMLPHPGTRIGLSKRQTGKRIRERLCDRRDVGPARFIHKRAIACKDDPLTHHGLPALSRQRRMHPSGRQRWRARQALRAR